MRGFAEQPPVLNYTINFVVNVMRLPELSVKFVLKLF